MFNWPSVIYQLRKIPQLNSGDLIDLHVWKSDGSILELCMRIATSHDKGRTWTKVAEIPVADNNNYNAPIDMMQTEDYLYLLTPDSKIYRVKKDDLMQGLTSVDDVFIEEEPSKCIDTQMFDLFGRKVTYPANGIYIQNGRKVIIR